MKMTKQQLITKYANNVITPTDQNLPATMVTTHIEEEIVDRTHRKLATVVTPGTTMEEEDERYEEEDRKPAAVAVRFHDTVMSTSTAGKSNHDNETVAFPDIVVPSELAEKAAIKICYSHLEEKNLWDKQVFSQVEQHIFLQFDGLVDRDGSIACESMKKSLARMASELKEEKKKEYEEAIASMLRKNEEELNWDVILKHMSIQALERFVP